MTNEELVDLLAEDVRLMLEHAMATGRSIQPAWFGAVGLAEQRPVPPDVVRRLVGAHDRLATLIAPATPASLRYLGQGASSARKSPLARWLGVLALVFLTGFVGLALDSDIGKKPAEFESGAGLELLVNLLFQLCAAGLGATFAALFAVNSGLKDHSLGPRDEFTSWVRVMLGLVSGLVLAQLAPIDQDSRDFSRPLLALLGGFSVDIVYQTLRRLVDLASSLVTNERSPESVAAAAREQAAAREAQLKVGLAQQLVRLRASLPEGEATAAMDDLIAQLSPSDVTPADPAPPAPAEPDGGGADEEAGDGADDPPGAAAAPDAPPDTVPDPDAVPDADVAPDGGGVPDGEPVPDEEAAPNTAVVPDDPEEPQDVQPLAAPARAPRARKAPARRRGSA